MDGETEAARGGVGRLQTVEQDELEDRSCLSASHLAPTVQNNYHGISTAFSAAFLQIAWELMSNQSRVVKFKLNIVCLLETER